MPQRIADWLDKNKEQVKSWGDEFRKAGEGISKWVVGKLDQVKARISSLTNSTEWKNATTIGEKMKLAWDHVISEPFAEWWAGAGKTKITKIAGDIGRGLGGALGGFIMSALGVASEPDKVVKESPFLSAGATAGKAFLDAFLDAFDSEKIAKKAVDAFAKVQGNLKDFAPGGKGPDFSSWSTLALDAFLLYKGGKGASKLFKGGKGAAKGIKGIWNFFKGTKGAAGAAGATTAAAETAAAAEAAGVASKAPGILSKIGGWFKGGAKIVAAATPEVGPAANIGPEYKAAGADFWKNADLKAMESRTNIVNLANAGKLSKYDDAIAAFGVAKAPGMMQKTGSFLKGLNPFKGGAGTKAVAETAEATAKIGKISSLLGKAGKGLKGIPILGAALGIIASGATVASASPKDRAKETTGEAGSWIGSIATGAALGAAGGAVGGSIVPGAGTVVGGTIGTIVGGIGGAIGGEAFTEWLYDQKDAITAWFKGAGEVVSGFFTKTLPSVWNGMWTGLGNFFTKSIPQWWNGLTTTVGNFFTQTVPKAWIDMWVGIGNFFTQTIPYAVGFVIGKAQVFFTQTLPTIFGNLWNSVSTFFTSTLPTWASNVWNNNIVPFFTQSIPTFFENLWNGISTFFTSTLPTWAATVWNNNIVPFFTQSIPSFLGSLWNGINTFFTSTLPTWAANIWNNNIVPFFTQSIPAFLSSLWNGVAGFFTNTIPTLAATIWGGIKDFVTNTIPNFFKDIWGSVTSFFSKGYNDATVSATPHATGGIMTRPHLGLVAEAGPEAIIPLSGGKRQRGLDLWEKTGRFLGVMPYADGGIAGTPKKPQPFPTFDIPNFDPFPAPVPIMVPTGGGQSRPSVKIEVQANPKFEIKAATSAAEVLEAIRTHGAQIADDLSDEIAEKLAKIFGNMPQEVEA